MLELADLAQDDGDLDEAWELARGGLEILADYGDRVGSEAALVGLADLAGALGRPQQALRLLAASERFRIETGIQSGWASPTPAERDLVRLVAQGHTNAEIGKRLFMSVNTGEEAPHRANVRGWVSNARNRPRVNAPSCADQRYRNSQTGARGGALPLG